MGVTVLKLLDLTAPGPEENLAWDEALLDWCDAGDGPEVLRFWESQQYFVVVGYSNRVEREVNVAACRNRGIPILRRCSGGGTVLQGPGCLNYSLILRIDPNPALQTVTGTNRFVMERNRAALEALNPDSEIRNPKSEIVACGHTDLAIGGRKFSGNAQRRKRRAVLFHGTFLLDFDLKLVSELLPMPSKRPDYRADRGHLEFLVNLKRSASEVKAALTHVWGAEEGPTEPALGRVHELELQKYGAAAWNLKY